MIHVTDIMVNMFIKTSCSLILVYGYVVGYIL